MGVRRFVFGAFVFALSLVLLVFGFGATGAQASTMYDSGYTYDQTYAAALRLLRVDMGLKITEKDSESGYLMFEYTSPEGGKKTSTGSLEIVRAKSGTRVSVQLASMPAYHEQAIVDALAKKLVEQYGEAPAPVKDKDKGAKDKGDKDKAPEGDKDKDKTGDDKGGIAAAPADL